MEENEDILFIFQEIYSNANGKKYFWNTNLSSPEQEGFFFSNYLFPNTGMPWKVPK